MHRSIPPQLEMDKYERERDVSDLSAIDCQRETVKMRHLESVQISGCRRSYSSDLFVFFSSKPNVSEPSWQPPAKAAYVGLHCIRHVERSFQLSCYTLENIYKYLAPRSRRSREIHSAQKKKKAMGAGCGDLEQT